MSTNEDSTASSHPTIFLSMSQVPFLAFYRVTPQPDAIAVTRPGKLSPRVTCPGWPRRQGVRAAGRRGNRAIPPQSSSAPFTSCSLVSKSKSAKGNPHAAPALNHPLPCSKVTVLLARDVTAVQRREAGCTTEPGCAAGQTRDAGDAPGVAPGG